MDNSSSIDQEAREKCPRFRAASYTDLPRRIFDRKPKLHAMAPYGILHGRFLLRAAVNDFSLDASKSVPSRSKYAAMAPPMKHARYTQYMS
jgi:hypothetical protein